MAKRTDMAVEEVELDYEYDENKVIYNLEYKKLTVDEELSKKINKAKGIYYNIDNLDYHINFENIIKLLKEVLTEVLKEHYDGKNNILIVGLGNDSITPDSLGPMVVNKIEVNRHLEKDSKYNVSAICPGVKGCTGLESVLVVKSICDEFGFDLVIVIDALACNHINRMCNSIQLCTSEVRPGAGIGNHRMAFNKDTLGVDVLAIGIPTVSDMDCYIDVESGYFVTPNHIDEAIDILSLILSISLNETLLC